MAAKPEMTRRTFLAVSATACGAAAAGIRGAQPPAAAPALPTALLGATGRTVPRLGLGAYPLGNLPDEAAGVGVVLRALERGVRYIDTAPSYGAGRSERRVGLAISRWLSGDPGRSRSELFVATKTLRRDGDGARRELEESLQRLGLDYVDSVQCHEVHDDVDGLFGPGRVVEALEKARDARLVRHIGITGHRDPKHLVAAITRYPFATALVPVNPIDVQHLSFVRGFLPAAAERGVAAIAMKVFGGGFLLDQKRPDGKAAFTPADLLAYALAQPGVAVVVPGCDSLAQVDEDHAAVAADARLSPEALADMERRAGEHKGKSTEWYKDDAPER